MMPRLFSVTYAIVTPESAECGEADETGFISQSVSLRDAVADLFATRTSHVGGIEYINDCGRWLSVSNGMEYETGDYEERCLHCDSAITESSWRRLVSLLRGA